MIDLTKKIEALQESGADMSEEGMARLKEELKNYEGEDMLIWWEDLRTELENEPEEVNHLTGVDSLDEIVGGFQAQQLAIVCGDSGHGKTQYGMYLLHCLKDLNPVMIPLEQSARELVRQRMSNGYEVPLVLSPRNSNRQTTQWIEERLVEGIAKYNTKLILIDHLGYIDNSGEGGKNSRENLAYRIGEVMRDLKSIAKRWNVIIILLVHISQHDEAQPPGRKDIKNSSDVIQECDTAMFVWRKNSVKNKIRVYDDKTLVSVQKNRRTGKNGSLGLEFDHSNGWYKEENEWVKQMEEMARQQVHSEDHPYDF